MEADGKICPYSLNVLLAPVPCSFGSQALFADEEARTHAEQTFHKYEWGSLHLLKAAELTPASKLALRIIRISMISFAFCLYTYYKKPATNRFMTLSKL